MAYVDRQSGTSRAASLATVGLIHAAIGAALIVGLAPPLIEIIAPPPPPDTFDVRNRPPPPPPEEQIDERNTPDSTVVAPDTKIDIPTQETAKLPDQVDYPPLPPAPNAGTGDQLAVNFPPTQPSFTPKRPQPANARSGWVTTADYPAAEIRRGNEGTVRFRVVVGTNGRVQSCEITGSSGFFRLDEAACAKVTSRARFEPATNEQGAKVVDTYSGTVVWRIPED